MMKLYRRWQTLILALLSFTMFAWSAVAVFDVASADILGYLFDALLLVGLLIVVASLLVLCLKLLKR